MALFFGGGVSFLEYFHEFLGLGHKKIFGMTLGQSQCFEIIIGQFRPLPTILWIWEIQKIWNFQYFWANLATFFFKIRFWTKLVLESLNMVFLTFFRSWTSEDGLYRFLIHFWAFKILSFHAFFMLKSVVFASFDATWFQNVFFLSLELKYLKKKKKKVMTFCESQSGRSIAPRWTAVWKRNLGEM